ncbi:endonuclease domain-containing protein [Winogradskyella sp. SM1960]|uniref:endonuclease domain-containing protein n=1 Tax=Winogradskyella sp. SM1960 TaxID=2865955 RepID=UPI001CD813F7|nr:endonuclease domain-containing protein [Winogradskyella sp. SM1960]
MNLTLFHNQKDSTHVLKFYDDNLVIGASSTVLKSEKEIAWLNRNNNNSTFGKGTYFIEQDEISFVLKSSQGSVIYKGKIIDKNSLIEFEIESLINGHKSTKLYSNTLTFNPIQDTSIAKDSTLQDTSILKDLTLQNTDFFPIILIPKNILASSNQIISNSDISNFLNIESPKLKQLDIPKVPDLYVHTTEEKTEFDGGGCVLNGLIIIGLIFVILFFISLNYAIPFWSLNFILGAGFIFYRISINYKTKSINKKTKIPENIYNSKLEDYKEKLNEVLNKNATYANEYFEKVKLFERKIELNRKQTELEIYYSTLIPFTKIDNNKQNLKRGKTELMFLNHLINEFGSQVKVDTFIHPYKYQPDFVFICDSTNLHIDIEIDEPYSFQEKKAIHYKESSDDERNENFLNENWCVIRFSEKQIITEPLNCINVIKSVVSSLKNKEADFQFNITKDKRWSYEESLVMLDNNYRLKY